MPFFKRGALLTVAVLALVLAFSTVALADDNNNVEEIKYVYFERKGDILVVDYDEALEDDQKELYNAMAKGVFEALIENKTVVVQTTEERSIDYTRAIIEGKSYVEAVEVDDYDTSRPVPEREIIYDEEAEENISFQEPDPDKYSPEEHPDWLVVLDDDVDDDKFKFHIETWESISKSFFIFVEIDEEIFAEEVTDNSIERVKIREREALEVETDDDSRSRWYIGIKEDELESWLGINPEDDEYPDDPDEDYFELRTNDVEVKAGVGWHFE